MLVAKPQETRLKLFTYLEECCFFHKGNKIGKHLYKTIFLAYLIYISGCKRLPKNIKVIYVLQPHLTATWQSYGQVPN